jgi:diadenosine tetraphosphate (Ap4A) HIT family hydrolase
MLRSSAGWWRSLAERIGQPVAAHESLPLAIPDAPLCETPLLIARYDAHPTHAVHVVIEPRAGVTIDAASEPQIVRESIRLARRLVRELGIDDSRYRLVVDEALGREREQLRIHLIVE